MVKEAKRGCPQGSVFGLDGWNLQFDYLLAEIREILGDESLVYADDLAVLISGQSRVVVERKAQQITDVIVNWCKSAKLELSATKSEALYIKGAPNKSGTAKSLEYPSIKIDGIALKFRDSVRYLGIHFGQYIRYLGDKMRNIFWNMKRLSGAIWGLKYKAQRVIYTEVFESIVTYASAGWSDLCRNKDWEKLQSIQRTALQAVIKSYSTTSISALCVLAAVLPVRLCMERSVARYNIRKGKNTSVRVHEILAITNGIQNKRASSEIDNRVNELWQLDWNTGLVGRKTYSFIPEVKRRLDSEFLKPNFFVTQFLTGHGDFQSYLCRFGKSVDQQCSCEMGEETHLHVLFDCPLWDAQRESINAALEGVSEQERLTEIVSTRELFGLFTCYCGEILQLQKQET